MRVGGDMGWWKFNYEEAGSGGSMFATSEGPDSSGEGRRGWGWRDVAGGIGVKGHGGPLSLFWRLLWAFGHSSGD